MKPLYLLAFLLTANQKDAEQCFTASIVEASQQTRVFRAWAESWVKRCLIKNAVGVVLTKPDRISHKRDLWCEGEGESAIGSAANAVTGLGALERFVFVLTFLEGYSARECSLLLNCTTENVARLQVQALRRLAGAEPSFAASLAGPSGCLGASA